MRLHPSWLLALSVGVSLGVGCATPGDFGRDAGRRTDAPISVMFDTGPRTDAPGTDAPVPEIDGGDPGFDGGDPGVDAGDPGIDASSPGTDAGAPGTDSGVPGTDSGPRPDAPGDRCAGVSCTMFDGPCSTGTCNPATGGCTLVPRMDGLTCDDGNPCTVSDTCGAGACRAGTARDCSSMTSGCVVGVCTAAAGGCTTMPVADGTTCGGGGCGGGTCTGGTCISGGVADCTSCGSGTYCASGSCVASPTTLTYGFESGTLPTGWTNGVGGTTGWSIVGTAAHSGSYGARSGAIGHSSQSRMSFTITLASAASIRFWLMTSSEVGYDFLQFYVDGAIQGSWSGTTAWTEVAVDVAAGAHTFEWRYTKDVNTVGGSDLVAIDDITIGPPSGASTGFESPALPAGYTTSGSPAWFSDTTMPRSGARCAASGAIGDSATTSLLRTVNLASATTLTYWYRVSTEVNYDYLRVFIDGAMAGQYSGTVAWTMASHALTAGPHTIEWRYSKDVSLSSGSDRVWIDDVDFGPTPPGGPLCGP